MPISRALTPDLTGSPSPERERAARERWRERERGGVNGRVGGCANARERESRTEGVVLVLKYITLVLKYICLSLSARLQGLGFRLQGLGRF